MRVLYFADGNLERIVIFLKLTSYGIARGKSEHETFIDSKVNMKSIKFTSL